MRGETIYRALLYCYPAEFRREYGSEMALAFTEQLRQARGNVGAQASLWAATARDLILVAPVEHGHTMRQDVQYAVRMLAASPGFSAVAILSMALGIGASTAIFSLLSGVMFSSLPVRDPGRLVILTEPGASGNAIGVLTGNRPLMSYAEVEQMRELTDVFADVMAAQSALDKWQARIDGAEAEEVRGRLVSGNFFDMLGVRPAAGRLFTAAEATAPGSAPYAVISHDFWRRRFGGRFDVLGKPVVIRRAPLTIIGVAAEGFRGETVGQRPDLWIPLAMQAGVIPGRDWLHDIGIEKVMWLHVFARLQPAVTLSQAETGANMAFRNALAAYYGARLDPSSSEYQGILDQRLKLRPAGMGASRARGRISSALYVLLGVAGAVLLIACVNIANLLLARAANREKEIALRLFLGASRGRLFRQMLTESLVLATAGGVLGMAAAYALHRALVALVVRTEESFHMDFTLDVRVAAFAAVVTAAAAIVCGVLPALRASRGAVGGGVTQRASTATSGQLVWGRALVAAQIALSLPLLVGAGLFLRTFYNLRSVELGYSREKLLLVRIDAQMAGYDSVRRPLVYRRLLDEFRRTPGVRAATFSENGLFSGRDSADELLVEGHTPAGANDKGSNWDQVGPDYFSTLGIPLRMGREITAADQANSPRVCVINEAFQKLFFDRRDPLGMHITSIFGNTRLTCSVVGVAANARGRQLKDEVEPRFYAPITQPLGEYDSVEFEIRAAGDAGRLGSAVREAMRRVDANLPVIRSLTLDAAIDERTAIDRILSRLSLVFGIAALALTAVGLFGVLSYGVTRRRNELGIRLALGAQPAGVTAMVLRETAWLVAAGLAAGAVLSAAAARFLSGHIYGVTPQDPATAASAIILLLAVALLAAWLPAHRASRLDPMETLRVS